MLLVYSKYTGKFPVDRFVFTMCISLACMVVLLYIAIVQSIARQPKEDYIDDEEFLNVNFVQSIEDFSSSLEEINRFVTLNQSEMDRLSQRMDGRRQAVKDTCDRLGIERNKPPNSWEYLINNKHHLIWCNVFKAASTTWIYNFNLLGGLSHSEAASAKPPVWLAREIYPRPTADQLLKAHSEPESVAFIIVRHPFERISSAYRDKLLSGPTMGMYSDLAEEIIMKHRKRRIKADESFLHQLWPTFAEFITFILSEAKDNRPLDEHWTPYTSFCSVCQFDFDVIITFETIEEDQNYLVQKAGLTNILTPHWKNSGIDKIADRGRTTKDILKDHYSQLTLKQMKDLYQIYRNDFEMFNYTIQEYYDMARTIPIEEMSTENSSEQVNRFDTHLE